MAQRGVDTSDEEYIPYFAGETLGSDSEHEYRYSDEDEEGYSDPEDFLFGEDDEDPNAAVVWDDGFSPINAYETYDKPPIPESTGHLVGHGVDVTLEQTQSEFFKLFLDEEIVIYLCTCMNAKARFWFQEESARKGYQVTTCNGATWHDVTPNDMYLYFALILYMGVKKEPAVDDYWSGHPMKGGHPIVRQTMSRSRFRNMTKFLRFIEQTELNQKFTAKERLGDFIDLLTERCKRLVHPGEHLSIDEALILWKGRLHFKQFIKLKRSRFGIKVFFLCPGDPKWQGYSWNFSIYYGANSDFEIPEVDVTAEEARSVGKSGRVVLHLMQGLFGSGRHPITDNWYTSRALGLLLYAKKTMLTGTIRKDRGIPAELAAVPLPRHSHRSCFATNGTELCVKYEDRATVHLYTTRYDTSMKEKQKYQPGGQQVTYKRPLAIELYNKLMGGVDMADKLLQPYLSGRKSRQWFVKLGLHFIQRMNLNAYIMWKNVGTRRGQHAEYLAFIRAVYEQLLCTHSPAVADTMTAYRQGRLPQAPQSPQAPRPSYLARQNRQNIERMNQPRRPPPQARGPVPGDDDSDDDSDEAPDAGAGAVAVAELVSVPGTSRQPDHLGQSVSVPGTSRQPDPLGVQPTGPTANPVSPGDSTDECTDGSPRIITELQPQQQAPAPKLAPEPVSVPQGPPIFHQQVKLPPTAKQKHPTKRCYVHFHKYKTKAEARAAGWMKKNRLLCFVLCALGTQVFAVLSALMNTIQMKV